MVVNVSLTTRFTSLWAIARDAHGSARAAASLVLADFCESVGDHGMAASARGWASNPNGAYIPYTPWVLTPITKPEPRF